jgi:hypothetical protein
MGWCTNETAEHVQDLSLQKEIKESHESKTNGKSTKKRKQDARDAPDDERSADNDEDDNANDELPANAFPYR